MNYRKLERANFEASTLAFGAWQLGDPDYWGSDAEADGAAAVRAALDAGFTLFDTAEMYGGGESERALGKALGHRRGEALIASKVSAGHGQPGALRSACEASLERLNTDWLDLYQVHWPFRDVSFEDACATMQSLRDEGKIRAVGVSNFGPEDLAAWANLEPPAANQLGYNLLFRAIEFDIVPACKRLGAGILVYMPLLQGLLAGRWDSPDAVPEKRRRTRHFSSERSAVRHGQPGHEALTFEALAAIRRIAEEAGVSMATLALAWTMAQPGVTSVIVGARNPGQVARNAEAAEWSPPQAVLDALDEATSPLKEAMGSNADMWMAGGEARIH
jgi:aryl-alcohol dehydrogenase-like predicted oxidoreductase